MGYFEMRRRALAKGTVWWLTDTVSFSDVLAAYTFKGVESAAIALQDVSGHNRTLTPGGTNAPEWSTEGYTLLTWGYLDNSAVRNANPVTIICKFYASRTGAAMLVSGGFPTNYGRNLYLSVPYTTGSFNYLRDDHLGFQYDHVASGGTPAASRVSSNAATSGVVAIDFSNNVLRLNGETISTSAPSGLTGAPIGNTTNAPGRLIGMRTYINDWSSMASNWNLPEHWTWKAWRCSAIAFYNRTLTATEHRAIYNLLMTV